jgi:hypothetical protein
VTVRIRYLIQSTSLIWLAPSRRVSRTWLACACPCGLVQQNMDQSHAHLCPLIRLPPSRNHWTKKRHPRRRHRGPIEGRKDNLAATLFWNMQANILELLSILASHFDLPSLHASMIMTQGPEKIAIAKVYWTDPLQQAITICLLHTEQEPNCYNRVPMRRSSRSIIGHV